MLFRMQLYSACFSGGLLGVVAAKKVNVAR
jgi:hypothetical protein